ncbi:MAG TPA: TIR domain-containing protein [Sphingomicrobium sp.]
MDRKGGGVSGTDIFLSYARTDRSTARMFAECLVQEGFTVWWDASLHSGETFDEVIEHNLREAKAVVVLWSKASVASRWVRAEATLADRRNKLAPAIIEPCDRPIIFELTHAAELADWTGETTDARWQTFVSDLRRLVDAHQDDQPAVPSSKSQAIAGKSDTHGQAGRQPLRPGNDQVIFADRVRAKSALRPEAPAAVVEYPREVHCLEVEEGNFADGPILIESSVKVGRTAPADIVISDKSVSREHCIIGLANDELLVTDLNSTNGTFIDDIRIMRATILPVGSVLRVGQISLRHAICSGPERQQLSRGTGGLQPGRAAATS